MRDKPDQISGFKRAPCPSTSTPLLFDRFCDVLRESAPDALEIGMRKLESKGQKVHRETLWDNVVKKGTQQDSNQQITSGFSFDFDLEDDGISV